MKKRSIGNGTFSRLSEATAPRRCSSCPRALFFDTGKGGRDQRLSGAAAGDLTKSESCQRHVLVPPLLTAVSQRDDNTRPLPMVSGCRVCCCKKGGEHSPSLPTLMAVSLPANNKGLLSTLTKKKNEIRLVLAATDRSDCFRTHTGPKDNVIHIHLRAK